MAENPPEESADDRAEDAPERPEEPSAVSAPEEAESKAKPPRRGPSKTRARSRRRRRLLGALVLFGPVLWVLLSDLARRYPQVAAFDKDHKLGYAGSFVESAIVWAVILHAASRRRGVLQAILAPIFVLLFTLAVGVEGAFNAIYNVYLSIDGQVHSKSIAWSIVGTLPLSRPIVIFHFAFACALAIGLVRAARKYVRPGRLVYWLVAALLPVAFVAPTQIPVSFRKLQSTAPDMIYFNGIAGLVREHLGYTHDSPDLRVQKRHVESVPTLHPTPARPRNVLFILQESQRADVTCIEYDTSCDKATPHSNKVVPDRMPL